LNHWAGYIASLPIYDRVLIAHENPNNFPLIDRAVQKCSMAVIEAVRVAMAAGDAKASEVIRG
jgi:hypothetical protein